MRVFLHCNLAHWSGWRDRPHIPLWLDLRRLIRHHVEFAMEKRHLVNVFQRESRSLTGGAQRAVQGRMRLYEAQREATLARCFPGASTTDVACGAQAAIGLIHSVAFWPPQALKPDKVVDLLCRLTERGLSALDTADA